MAESLVLTTPEVTPAKSTTEYRVIVLNLDYEQSTISIVVRGSNGEKKSFEYTEQKASDLMKALNKANNSVKSLHKRVLEQLSNDGLLVGTVTGAPE